MGAFKNATSVHTLTELIDFIENNSQYSGHPEITWLEYARFVDWGSQTGLRSTVEEGQWLAERIAWVTCYQDDVFREHPVSEDIHDPVLQLIDCYDEVEIAAIWNEIRKVPYMKNIAALSSFFSF